MSSIDDAKIFIGNFSPKNILSGTTMLISRAFEHTDKKQNKKNVKINLFKPIPLVFFS
jgi:hypothetical protein